MVAHQAGRGRIIDPLHDSNQLRVQRQPLILVTPGDAVTEAGDGGANRFDGFGRVRVPIVEAVTHVLAGALLAVKQVVPTVEIVNKPFVINDKIMVTIVLICVGFAQTVKEIRIKDLLENDQRGLLYFGDNLVVNFDFTILVPSTRDEGDIIVSCYFHEDVLLFPASAQ